MTYSDLLQQPEWQKKRQIILERDKLQCQECQNEAIKKSSQIGELIELSLLDSQMKGLLNRSNPNWRYDRPKYYVTFWDRFKTVKHESPIYIYGWINFDKLEKLKGAEILYTLHRTDPNDFFTPKVPIVHAIKDNADEEKEWLHINNIHVHHTYYQEGLNPWEYPDDSLVSLCWKCHEDLHANETIPKKDRTGRIVGSLTNCTRCFGAGYFPQYSHVQNGICFQCEGAKYEEFL